MTLCIVSTSIMSRFRSWPRCGVLQVSPETLPQSIKASVGEEELQVKTLSIEHRVPIEMGTPGIRHGPLNV